MKTKLLIGLVFIILLLPGCAHHDITSKTTTRSVTTSSTTPSDEISSEEMEMALPEPRYKGNVSLEEALLQRRSVREYSAEPLMMAEVSQLLWAAQGITSTGGNRTAPSAGGLYPLEVYLVAGNVENLAAGVYRYIPEGHKLATVKKGDIRKELAKASLDQSWVGRGAIDIVIAAVYEKTSGRYGERATRYVDMEAGHAAQNLCLQATALGLGAVTVGAFHDEQVQDALDIPTDNIPLYVIPVGRKT
jgi:SagB-type dehydrogenase family enzyme